MKNLFTILIFVLTSLQFFPQKISVPQNDNDLVKHWKALSSDEQQKQIDELKNILTEQNFSKTQDLNEIKVKINLKLESLLTDLDNGDLLLQIISLYKEFKEKRKDDINKDFKLADNDDKSLGRVTIRPNNANWWTGHVRKTTVNTYEDVNGEVTFGNSFTGYNYRGYVMFYLSGAGIPSNATVYGISMWFYRSVGSNSSSHTTLIKGLNDNPILYSGLELWNFIDAGTTLLNLFSIFQGSNNTFITWYSSSGNLINHLQQKINAGSTYWALGFVEDGDNNDYATFRGWNWGGLPEPYFHIDYIIPPVANNATNITLNSFTANWGSVTDAEGYRLDVSTNSSFTSRIPGYDNLDVGNVTSRSVTGLTAGTTYYYRVRAHKNGFITANSNTISLATITIPPAPSANAATNVTQTSFTANWNVSTGSTGYRLDVSTNSSFSSFVPGYNDLDVGNVTSRSVTGLTAGTTYYYRVRAYNSWGTSGHSNPITVLLIPPNPVATSATNVTQTSFTANWNISTGATGYRLYVSTDTLFANIVTGYNGLDVGNVTSKNVSGLVINTRYYYRVKAYNSSGESDYSNTPNPIVTSIEDLEFINGIPTDYSLFNNYPNPFNPSTFIEFGLSEESNTQLKIYDILGNEVAVLLDNEILSAGRFRYELNAKGLTSGTYIYVMTAQSMISKQIFRDSKKLILLK